MKKLGNIVFALAATAALGARAETETVGGYTYT